MMLLCNNLSKISDIAENVVMNMQKLIVWWIGGRHYAPECDIHTMQLQQRFWKICRWVCSYVIQSSSKLISHRMPSWMLSWGNYVTCHVSLALALISPNALSNMAMSGSELWVSRTVLYVIIICLVDCNTTQGKHHQCCRCTSYMVTNHLSWLPGFYHSEAWDPIRTLPVVHNSTSSHQPTCQLMPHSLVGMLWCHAEPTLCSGHI